MITVTKHLAFCAAHRLCGHEGKCRNVHGHNYTVEVELTAPQLDHVGRVIDFSVIKERLGAWIDDNWDHAYLGEQADPILGLLKERGMKVAVVEDGEPTAEHMAAQLYRQACKVLEDERVDVVALRIYETPTSRAE